MKAKIVLLIAFIVILSGCVSRPVVVDDNGITINSFTTFPSISEAFEGENVIFEIEIENTGGTTARNVVVDMSGVEGQWRDITGASVPDTQQRDFGSLRPPLPARNIPGEFRLHQWNLMTPDFGEGITVPLSVIARVKYDYNTSGFLSLPVYSEGEYRRKQINSEALDSPQIVNSKGPIHLSVPTNDNPIIVNTFDSNPDQVWPVRILFQNVGNGFPITRELSGDNRGAGGRITGEMGVFGPGVSFHDCLGVTEGNRINLDESPITLRLRDTNEIPVACTIKIDKDQWGERPQDSIIFVFNVFYTYYVDDEVQVRVIGLA